MSVRTVVKAIQDIMRQDVGVDGDAQRISQLCWMFFLKILDDQDAQLELMRSGYTSPLPPELRWRAWAADPEGMTGDGLLSFINNTLFPHLKDIVPAGPQAHRQAVVRGVFEDAYNYMKSGQLIRQVINKITEIDFNNLADKQHFGDVYETLLSDLQSAGNAGEYYTPRAVTTFMAERLDPRPGEILLDPACGTGGFLTCSIRHMRERYVKKPADEALMQSALRAVEKKPLPHMLCTTNMLLHGVEDPSFVRHDNTLAKPYVSYGQQDRVDIVLTNPPFQGREEPGVESNFPLHLRTRDTADLFLALVLRLLRPGARAGIVLPDSSLFGEDMKLRLREMLLDECDLHTLVRLPVGVFAPYTDTRTNLLFFTKGRPTQGTWYYDLKCPSGAKYTKTKPITSSDFRQVSEWWDQREPSVDAWYVTRDELRSNTYNLDIANPHRRDLGTLYVEAAQARDQALQRMEILQAEVADLDGDTGGDARVGIFIARVASLAPSIPLTSGVLEDLRTALTDLALRGALSKQERDDEKVDQTIGRYSSAARRRRQAASGRPKPPFDIPPHWRWCRLAELTDFAIGKTPATTDARYWPTNATEVQHPWVAIKDMPRRGFVTATAKTITDAAATSVFGGVPVPDGALLMAFKLSVGKTAILGMPSYHNEAITSMLIDDDALRLYLLWALPALATYAATNPAIRGQTLNSKSIAGLWVPIPPRQEQQRLIARLEQAVELVERSAERSQEIRAASDRVMKLMGQDRVMSVADGPTEPSVSGRE